MLCDQSRCPAPPTPPGGLRNTFWNRFSVRSFNKKKTKTRLKKKQTKNILQQKSSDTVKK